MLNNYITKTVNCFNSLVYTQNCARLGITLFCKRDYIVWCSLNFRSPLSHEKRQNNAGRIMCSSLISIHVKRINVISSYFWERIYKREAYCIRIRMELLPLIFLMTRHSATEWQSFQQIQQCHINYVCIISLENYLKKNYIYHIKLKI